MERFFIEQNLHPGPLKINDPETVYKMVVVLRGRPGDTVSVFGLNKKEFLAEIKTLDKKQVELQLGQAAEKNTEPGVTIILYPSLLKKNRFEMLLEKCTEIGVTTFQPIITARSVVKTEDSPQRWNKIAIEAAQQSGRTTVPKINSPIKLEQALKNIKDGKILVGAEQAASGNIIKQLSGLSKQLHLFIGPEGGWEPKEFELFKNYQALQLNLGARILRAETAAMVLSALCVYLAK